VATGLIADMVCAVYASALPQRRGPSGGATSTGSSAGLPPFAGAYNVPESPSRNASWSRCGTEAAGFAAAAVSDALFFSGVSVAAKGVRILSHGRTGLQSVYSGAVRHGRGALKRQSNRSVALGTAMRGAGSSGAATGWALGPSGGNIHVGSRRRRPLVDSLPRRQFRHGPVRCWAFVLRRVDEMRRIATNRTWGLKWGAMAGSLFAGFAGISLALRHELRSQMPAPWPYMLLAYASLGLAAGLLLGISRPFLRSRRSAMGIGSVAAAPVAFAFLAMARGPVSGWSSLHWSLCVAAAVWLGCLGGWIFWEHASFDPADFITKQHRRER